MCKEDNYQDMNWATISVEKRDIIVAPMGSSVDIGLDGKIEIKKPPVHVLNQPRDSYGQNDMQNDDLVLPIQQDITWTKDLYN